ncbi:MAG: DUF4292 domain-containing protein [Bacteroidota bacterium]
MKNVIYAALCLMIIASCRPAKKIQKVVSIKDTEAKDTILKPNVPVTVVDSVAAKAEIFTRVNSNKIDFNFFTGKIKVDYTDQKGKEVSPTIFVRIKKDSIIWLSVTGLLGVEGFRLLVKPDTVIIMDKLAKKVSYKSVSYLQELIKLPVDFGTLQDLLVGNAVFFPPNIVSYDTKENTLLALSVGDFFKHLITIDTSDNRILHSKLDDVQEARNRTCHITMSDYNQQQGRLFSNIREITVTEKTQVQIKLEYKQVNFDEPQTFPFNIPKNYTVK